jgi:hypothetical protein
MTHVLYSVKLPQRLIKSVLCVKKQVSLINLEYVQIIDKMCPSKGLWLIEGDKHNNM